MYTYGVTFYSPWDDGSHPYGDYTLKFSTPDEAFAYGDAEVERMWQERRAEVEDKAWFDDHVEKEIFVVDVRRKVND